MAKVTFWCDNNANIHSRKKETFDTVKDLGMKEREWETMTDEEKNNMYLNGPKKILILDGSE